MASIYALWSLLLLALMTLAAPCNGIDDRGGNFASVNESHPSDWYNRGETRLNEGKYDEAIEAYDRAIKLNSSHTAAWRQKGNALYNLSKFDESLLCYEKAISIDPTDAENWYNKGISLIHLGRHKEAVRAFGKATKIDPVFADAWANEGLSFFYLGKYEESIDDCDQALRIDPANVLARIVKGYSLASLGRYDEATKSLDIAIKLDPKLSSLSWYYQGLNNLAEGKYEESIPYFDNAVETDPNLELAWSDRGIALAMLERYDEALKSFERAIKVNPKYAAAWNNIGHLFYIMGDYNESIKYFDEAINIDPEQIDAWIFKGLALEELERYNESIQSIDWGILLNPKNEMAWNGKGLVLCKLGRYNESIRAFDRALKINPDYASAWNNKGIALAELGKYEDALECYDKAIEIDPNFSRAWNNKGWSLYNIDRLNESIECYDKAILLDPKYVNPWNNKALALFALGRDDEAEEAFARVRALTGYINAEPELVEAAYVRGHFSEGDGIWRAGDFGWFYYDLDKDLGEEELRIDLQGRTAEKGHIVYSSKTWSQQFEYEPWGSFQMVAFLGKPYLVGYHDRSFTDEIGSLGKGELRAVLIDEDSIQTFNHNTTLPLQQGYVLMAEDVSEKKGTVNFILLKNGKPVYGSMVSIGDTFVYKLNEVPVILVHLANIMQGSDEGLAEVDGIFQISDEPYIKLFEGGLLGNMNLTYLSEDIIEFQNNVSLTFIKDSEVPLTADLKIVVLNEPELSYYPVGGIFDYGVHEIRGPVFNSSSSIPVRMGDYKSSVIARWNSINYTGFCFDPEQSLGAETLVFYNVQDRTLVPPKNPIVYPENNTVVQSGLQYTTLIQPKEFEYKPWGSYFVIGFLGDPWFAGYNSSLDGKVSSKSLLEHGYLGRVLMDTELKGNILAGNYSLEDGYEMHIEDIGNDSLFLELSKEGRLVESAVVQSDTTYVYKKDLENVKDMPIIMMHVGYIFNDGTHSFASLDGIFQISDRYILPIEPGNGFGELQIVSVVPEGMIMLNHDSINLNSNSNVNIGPGMDIRVADNDTLRYYLYTSMYVVPPPEPPLISAPGNVSSSAAANFTLLVKAAEIRQVTVNILNESNRTVFSRDITMIGKGSGDLWGFAWKWNATTMQLSDDKSLVLDASGSPVPGLLYLNSSASPRLVGVTFETNRRLGAIFDSEVIYYISRGEYKRLNETLDYDAMLANNTARNQFIKIEPAKSILQFFDIVNGRSAPSGINHTLQGNLEALEPHAVFVGAKPGRYELQVRVENVVDAIQVFGEFFNVTANCFMPGEKGASPSE